MSYRTSPFDTDRMPPGVPWIIGNEAAERFSFYGMRTILAIFMVKYLHLMGDQLFPAMSEAESMQYYHLFVGAVYLTPLLGALLSDIFLGKYKTILYLSLLYCLGHAALACMGTVGNATWWLLTGLALICLGAGGIKPCVSSNVGDQFGPRNQHLLSRVYNWFYFSINFGSFFSTLLTPWVLEWYGPHWAFGIPGVLMGLATLLFFMGRKKFAHVPPAGFGFFKEMASKEGITAILKLLPLFLFIAMFWALYDQTASAWVFQAAQMDRHFMGFQWLESQVQAINPALILVFIPFFTYGVYPLANKLITLTPLRKIGIGFLLISASFALTAIIQSWIDHGETPTIGWQFVSFIIITASEIMVSIVGLEFAYTQAPKKMKSIIMALFLLSVFVGNGLTSLINQWIQIPSAVTLQTKQHLAALPHDWQESPRTLALPGYDPQSPADDFVVDLQQGKVTKLELPNQKAWLDASKVIESYILAHHGKLPAFDEFKSSLGSDLWGNPIQYKIISGDCYQLISNGPDQTPNTQWDQGIKVTVSLPQAPEPPSWFDQFRPQKPWLTQREDHFRISRKNTTSNQISFSHEPFCGGQTKLNGANYYWFFTWLMLGTLACFLPYACLYRDKTYLQD